MTAVATFAQLDTVDLYIEILNEQIANVTANFPAGPIKVSVLAELNAELAFYTALQTSLGSQLSGFLGAGVVQSLVGGVFIGVDATDPRHPIINYNGPLPGLPKMSATFDVSQLNSQPGTNVHLPIGTLPTNAFVLGSYIEMITGFNDGGAHGYTLDCTVTDGSLSYNALTVSETGTRRRRWANYTDPIVDTGAPATKPITAFFNYGGNMLNTLTVGQCAVSVLYVDATP